MKARVKYDKELDAMAIEIYDAEDDCWNLDKAFPCCSIEPEGPSVYLHMDIVHELLQLINLGYTVSDI